MKILQIHMISALIIIAFLEGCDFDLKREDERTETVELLSGTIIENETCLSIGLDVVRHNSLFIRRSPSSEREFLGEITYEGRDSLFALYESPKLYCDEDRAVLIIGPYVFKRLIKEEGPYWRDWNINTNVAALFFLRSFLDFTESEYVRHTDPDNIRRFDLNTPVVEYENQRFDFETNTLISKRKNKSSRYPEFLVFSAKKYKLSWRYDHLRTLEKNEIEPILAEDLSLEMEVSVITYKGKLLLADFESRESVLSAPKAKEILNQRIILNGKQWNGICFSFSLPDGTVIKDRHDAVFGFFDPLPDHLSIFWREHPTLWSYWYFVKLGEWERASAVGYKGNIYRIIFFRILRA